MAKKVRIPTPLRKLTNNEELVEVGANTVGEAIVELQTRYPGIQERLVDEKGEVRRFVNVYVNEEDIRFLNNRATPLKDGDEISIIPAIAGGKTPNAIIFFTMAKATKKTVKTGKSSGPDQQRLWLMYPPKLI